MRKESIYNLMCDFCGNYLHNQEHLLQCQVLRQHIKWNHEDIKYDHIYGSLVNLSMSCKICKPIMRKENIYIMKP